MHIAILADPLDNQNAGVHVFTREMIHGLLRKDVHNQYILVRANKDRQFDRYPNVEQCRIPIPGMSTGFAPLRLLALSLRLFILIPLFLNFRRVDVVVEPAHFGPFNLRSRIRRITVIHDLTPVLFPEFHRWHSQFLQNTFLRGILRRTDLVVANSDNTARDIIATYPECSDKVRRIYPGREERFQFQRDPRVLQKHGVREPFFLFVGTIEPRKNLLLLLESYHQFRVKTSAAVQLVIAGGEGWKSEGFLRALERHPFKADIIRPGFVSAAELPVLYSSAVALVYPSIYEGFGLPILEAASCGTAVITADNSSLPEAAGPGALYFSTGDSGDLANRMEELYGDQVLRDDLGSKGLAHAQQFSWDKFATELLVLLTRQG